MDKHTWRLMEDAYDVERSGDALQEAQLLPHLVAAMHRLAFRCTDDAPVNPIGVSPGSVLTCNW